MDPMIHVEGLVKRYHRAARPAVDDISFDVQPGEFFAFLGPNGAGKTTTISILTTTLAKSSGRVTIAGHDLDEQASLVRRDIGIIFQTPSLDLHLTAEENIRLHVCLYGLYGYRPFYRLMPRDYRRRVGELAELVGIKDNLFKPLRTYSGGMRRKLEIVRSLMHRPSVLFLDEPTAGLDAVSRHALWEYLQQARASEGTTIFLTTHYLEEAEGADRVCVVNGGHIAMLGAPDEIKGRLLDRYLLLDAKNRTGLESELQSLGVAFTEDAELGLLRVPFTSETPQPIIARLTTPLSVLRTVEPTLEQAYVELLRASGVGEEGAAA